MKQNLKTFVDKIFSINPSFSNIFGSGIPGMSGTSITTTGSSSAASEIVYNLRRATGQFAEKVSTNASTTDIESLAQAIEGNLLNLLVLGQISERFSTELIEELHALTHR